MIDVRNLTKRYYSLVAVDDVSFTIPQGEVLGILGPNGAGKTTLFKMIAGLLQPDSGEIVPDGGTWPTISLKPERLLFPNHLRVRAYLEMVARLGNLPGRRVKVAVNDSLARVKLADAAQKRIGECSKGMRQRLSLAQALIGRPALLLLDEPSNGLDPEGQEEVCRIVEGLRTAGHTNLLSSHHLQEVTRTCTYLIILNQGQIHYQSSMADALRLKPHVTIRASNDLSTMKPLLESLHPRLQVDGDEVTLYETASDVRRHVLSIILSAGYDVVHVEQKRATLEETYAEATQWSNAPSP